MCGDPGARVADNIEQEGSISVAEEQEGCAGPRFRPEELHLLGNHGNIFAEKEYWAYKYIRGSSASDDSERVTAPVAANIQ